MSALLESLNKATQAANLTVSDIREAHKAAIRENLMAEILLLDLIKQAAELELRLQHIRDTAEAISKGAKS